MIDNKLLAKKDKILELRTKIKDQGRAGKRNLEKEWFRNILFLVGNQWIIWNKSKKKWEEAVLDDWIERPVTNKFAASHNTLKTILTQKEPRTIVKPATDSDEDIATAKFGDVIVDVLNTESGRKKAREIASSWLVATGNCFFHSYYYVDKSLGQIFIPFEQCQNPECGAVVPPDEIENDTCPKCQTQGQFGKAIGPDGKQMGSLLPKGKLVCDAPAPFEMFFNQECEKWEDVREVVRAKVKEISQARDLFPDIAEKIVPAMTGTDQSEMMTKALAHVSNTGDAGASSAGSGAGASAKVENVTIDYVFSLPSREFPNGVMATIIGDEIAELSTMDAYTDKDGVHFIPIDHIGANRVSGRLWHKTLLDDIAAKQVARNKLESFILTFVYSMSGGKWMVPEGCNMDDPTGDPNQVLNYAPLPNGPAPQMVPGLSPHQVLLGILQQMDTEIEELSATYDILKGQRPPGVDTYSGLALLEEKANSRHNEMISNWEAGDEAHTKKQLEIARKHFIEPRKKTYENEMGSYETKQFSKADLQGGLDIQVEPGSSVPRSKAIENATILDLVKQQIVNAADPKVNFKILEKLGQTELASGIGEDIKDAAAEWNAFYDAVVAAPDQPQTWLTRPRVGIDNEVIHLADAISRAKSDKFFEMPPNAQQLWMQHIAMHQMAMDQQMMKQAAMQGPAEKPGEKKEVAA